MGRISGGAGGVESQSADATPKAGGPLVTLPYKCGGK
jgi:hypothetical protein